MLNSDDDELFSSFTMPGPQHMTMKANNTKSSNHAEEFPNVLSLSSNKITIEVDHIQKPKLINNFASIAPSDDF